MFKWVVVVAIFATSGMAQAQSTVSTSLPTTDSTPYSGRKWPAGSGARGTRGVNRVEAAVPMPGGTWVLTAGGRYFHSSDFLADGDSNTYSSGQFTLAWQPIELIAITASWSVVSNKNDQAEPRTTQSLGDPTFGVKLTHVLGNKLGLGLDTVLLIPTSAGGSGLKPSAFALDARALVSYLPTPWLALSANAGYRLDNTDEIFGSREISRAQRFTASVATVNQILVGVGADTFFLVGDRAAIGPFAELTAGIAGGGGPSAQNPILATLGGRIQPAGKDVVDISLGGDIRVSGAPRDDSLRLPGIPPWQVFARMSVHLGGGGGEHVVSVTEKNTCSGNDDCGKGQTCMDHVCTITREVIREVTKEVPLAAPTFSVDGAVLDQTSGDPVGSAVVTLGGYETSPLAVDFQTGKFHSFPIPVGEGLIKVTVSAPNYRPAEQTIQRGTGDQTTQLTFKLQSLGEAATGQMKGSIKDGRSGKPLKGEIFIPALGKRLTSDKDGLFDAELKSGRYQVLISAPKYVTQKKEIEIRAGEVVILNLDMVGKK
ncbi:MAG: collagen binding domain-containing protein [Myxococcota bacterium]